MANTFKGYTEGRYSNLKFSPGLVLGWLTEDSATQTETRYALFSNGRVLQAEPVSMFGRGSDEFAPNGRKWAEVQTIPASAEFIGNYKPPRKEG